MQPFSGKQRPDSDEHVLYCACHGKCIFADLLQMSHACHRFWKCYKIFTSDKLHNPLRLPRETTSERPKPRMWYFLNIFTSKCASGVFSKHLNFQKRSGPGVFCTFGLRNVLRATTACIFSSLIWPAGSAPAALASLLFDLPEPQISVRDFLTFSCTWIVFLLRFSLFWYSFFFSSLLWLFPPLRFHLSILSEVWFLNFLRSGLYVIACNSFINK